MHWVGGVVWAAEEKQQSKEVNELFGPKGDRLIMAQSCGRRMSS